MNKKRKKLPSTIYKAAIILAGGALVALAFTVNIDTSSWFTSQVQQEIKVSAATTKDIIEKFDIVKNKDGSQKIKIKKKEGLDYNPTVFFSVEGDVKDYILHINPVTLENNGYYYIPIELNINNRQFINALHAWLNDKWFNDNKYTVEGTIRLKYLNNYIDEEKEISFSGKYIMKEYWNAFLSRNNNKDIVDLMEQMAHHVDWQKEEPQPEKIEAKVAMTNVNSTESVSENIIPNINKVILSPYQSQILDVITPRLMPHVEKLYTTIENLTMTLNEKISEIKTLNQLMEECEAQIETLNEEKLNLENDNTTLSKNVESLENTNAELNKNIAKLSETLEKSNKKIDSISDSNSKLKSENSDLSQKLNDLTDENAALKEEVDDLKQQILELTTDKDDNITVPEEVYGD